MLELQAIFREVFDEANLELTRETTSSDIERWDSLTNVILVATIETKLGVRFKVSEISKLQNAGQLLDLIEQKKGQKEK